MKHPTHNISEISRVLRSKEDARASYDKLSRWYDMLAGSELRLTLAGVKALKPSAGERILEIGYGTGHAMVALAQAVGSSGRIFGMDISDGMRRVAEWRIQRSGLSSRIQLSTGDAASSHFASGSMDAVFMCFTLELFDTPEIPLVLKECRRLLASEGRICVVSMAKPVRADWILKAYEWMHLHFPKVADCRPIFVNASLKSAGFHVVSCTRWKNWGLPVDICLANKNAVNKKKRALNSARVLAFESRNWPQPAPVP
jgi:ubiquinone/menaquinone biosynthesis C-methylase UbiE